MKDVSGPGPFVAGDQVTYTLTVGNAGPSDADDVHVVDDLPSGLTALTADGPAGDGWTCTVAPSEVVCDRPTFPAPAAGDPPTTSVITVTAAIDPNVPQDTDLTNVSTVATSSPGDDPADNSSDATITVDAVADLAVTKTHPAGVVNAGETVTFTVSVTNDGPSDAVAPIEVTDTLPAGMTFVSSSGPWTCVPDGAGTTVDCDLDDVTSLASDATAPDLVIIALVDPTVDEGVLPNTAAAQSPTTDPVPGNNIAIDPVVVTQNADVRITKTHAGAVRVGDDVTFRLRVFNVGPSEARDVVVTDTLPDGLTYVSAAGTDWTCGALLRIVRCTYASPVPPGGFTPVIDLVTTVGPEAFPTVRNVADVETSTDGDNREDNVATDDVGVPAQVDLAVTKTHDADFVVGSDGTWTIEVTNDGPTPDPGPVTVTDTLPPGVTYVSATGDGVTCDATDQTVTCTIPGGVEIDTPVAITLVVAVQPDAYPSVTNAVTVTTPSEDVDPDNNTATDPVDVLPLARLAIAKDVVGIPGLRPVFQIVVTNLGPNVTTAPVVMTDDLPEGMTLVSVGGTGWTCSALADTRDVHLLRPARGRSGRPRPSRWRPTSRPPRTRRSPTWQPRAAGSPRSPARTAPR